MVANKRNFSLEARQKTALACERSAARRGKREKRKRERKRGEGWQERRLTGKTGVGARC